MRKLFVALAFLGICGASSAQVTDNAVIPISVTINSVLRLQVTSGGNIQFVFNTMSQFNTGIANTSRTTTAFNVSSSRPYTVSMGAEDATLIGVSTGGTADLGLITYTMGATGAGAASLTDEPLNNTGETIVDSDAAGTNQNYQIQWSAGKGTVKATGIAADTYVTNVFLTLAPQ